MKTIQPKDVIDSLKKHILVDGFHVVVDLEKSEGSYIVDARDGREYLDCYSQFASQALGWNHPALVKGVSRFGKTILHKIANSDMYTTEYAEFVETFAKITPDFKYHFFIDGGALAVENALKAAFDWKAQLLGLDVNSRDSLNLDVVHLTNAFHGRSGYTLSLTNTTPNKTNLFPRFNWTRLINPGAVAEYYPELERLSLNQAEEACKKGLVAAIILEPIQGEGGDIHFSKSFLQGLRNLANKYEVMLIFDEVQTGMGLTGKWWAYQHFDVVPDMMCFGKKTQVCGFCSTARIDKVKNNVFHQSSRINSTWGGNLVDMVRATIIIEAIKDNDLVENAQHVGNCFKEQLLNIENTNICNVRGRGLMLAFDLPNSEDRDKAYQKLSESMLVLKCGEKGIRLRPHLTFSLEDVEVAIEEISSATIIKSGWKWISRKKPQRR